jgi:hypothetical protein
MAPRPLKKVEQLQTARFDVRCTEEEKAEIIELSETYGYYQYSMFIRLASLGKIQVDRSRLGKNKKEK